MTNDDAKIIEEITADHATMKQVRQSYEAQWNDIVDLVLPRHGGFGRTQDEMNKGRERSQKIFDATTALALRNFTAAMDSMITPHTQVWHRLSVSDESLGELDSVKAYLEAVVKILFAVRYRWKAGFAPNIGSAYKSMGAFGQGGMMIEHVVGRGIRYRNIPLSRMYFAENEGGAIDKTHVCWTLTARQAARRFGRNALSSSMQMILESDPEKTFEFRHVVKPREDYDTRKLDSLNMPFASYWLDEGGQTIIQRSGFRTFPFAIGRFDLSSDETYAGSPAMDSLPDVRMVNDMAKTNIKGAQKMVDPPLLISEDGALEGFDLRSGSLNWGGLDNKGQEMVKAMQMGQQAQMRRGRSVPTDVARDDPGRCDRRYPVRLAAQSRDARGRGHSDLAVAAAGRRGCAVRSTCDACGQRRRDRAPARGHRQRADESIAHARRHVRARRSDGAATADAADPCCRAGRCRCREGSIGSQPQLTKRTRMTLGQRFHRFWNRRANYRGCFTDPSGKLTKQGEAVLQDLAVFCRANRSIVTVSPIQRTVDTHATMLAEGRREVYNRIVQILGMTDEQLTSLKDEADE
jgi:hypothetical protein